jgi:hypothetical protein
MSGSETTRFKQQQAMEEQAAKRGLQGFAIICASQNHYSAYGAGSAVSRSAS